MDFTNIIDDDKAVSPVIGVILMVAITVILAAVIGTFVLGLGDQVQDTSPQASFGFDYTNPSSDGDSLTITHQSGDEIEAANVDVVVSGASDDDDTSDLNQAYDWGSAPISGSGPVSAGTSITLDDSTIGDGTSNPLDLSGASVRVVWSSSDGSSSSTLGEWSGPDA